MFAKKRHGELCGSCDRPIDDGQKVCACGAATRHMDFSERTKYEVEQWRAHRDRAAVS
jgi:hypothetical protein